MLMKKPRTKKPRHKYSIQFDAFGGMIYLTENINVFMNFTFVNIDTNNMDVIYPADPLIMNNTALHDSLKPMLDDSEIPSNEDEALALELYEEFYQVLLSLNYSDYIKWFNNVGKEQLALTKPVDDKLMALKTTIDPIHHALDDINDLVLTNSNEFQLKQILHKLPKLFQAHNMALQELQMAQHEFEIKHNLPK
jgi:hypothetical protein